MRPPVKVVTGISSLRSRQREWGSRAAALLRELTPSSRLGVRMGEGRCPRRRRQARFMAGGYLSVRSEVSGLVHFPPDLASVIFTGLMVAGHGGVSWVREKSFGGLAIHVGDTACGRYSPPWRHRRDPFSPPRLLRPKVNSCYPLRMRWRQRSVSLPPWGRRLARRGWCVVPCHDPPSSRTKVQNPRDWVAEDALLVVPFMKGVI